jgi:hypothetical protein
VCVQITRGGFVRSLNLVQGHFLKLNVFSGLNCACLAVKIHGGNMIVTHAHYIEEKIGGAPEISIRFTSESFILCIYNMMTVFDDI